MNITLPAGFSHSLTGEEDVDCYVSTPRVQVTLERITFLTLAEMDFTAPALITPAEFREMIIESGGYNATLCESDGLPAFEYEFEGSYSGDGSLGYEMYKALCFVYKSDSAMWMVAFCVPVAHYEQWKSEFYQWTKTVWFTESDPGVYTYD